MGQEWPMIDKKTDFKISHSSSTVENFKSFMNLVGICKILYSWNNIDFLKTLLIRLLVIVKYFVLLILITIAAARVLNK